MNMNIGQVGNGRLEVILGIVLGPNWGIWQNDNVQIVRCSRETVDEHNVGDDVRRFPRAEGISSHRGTIVC